MQISVKEIGEILGVPSKGLSINMKPKARPTTEWADTHSSIVGG